MEAEQPLVSCLMVTRGALFPSLFAIDGYRRQTYPHRELIVVCDRRDSGVARLVGMLNDPTIRLVEAKPMVLGDLRNIAIDAAEGELICQWDDDDLYHPDRVNLQVEALAQSGAAAHLLTQVLFWWPARRRLALTAVGVLEGSIMARRVSFPRYQPLGKGEDSHILEELNREHRVTGEASPFLYCYIVHGRNTWGNPHFENILNSAAHVFEDYDAEFERFSQIFPLPAYLRSLEDSLSPTDADALAAAPATSRSTMSDRQFHRVNVTVDDVDFRRCRFSESVLVYYGGSPPTFDACTFDKASVRLEAAAGNAHAFLRTLKTGGILSEPL
jgi:glycosyltransferase involved in cell wall biosynthesis